MSEKVETPESKPKPKPTTTQLSTIVQSLQFAWFVGQVLTLLSLTLYYLTYLKIGSGLYKFWYKVAFVGVVESFGILIYQLFLKEGLKIRVLLGDDNTQYWWLGANLLLIRPFVLLTTTSFFLFSVFHVLAYTKGYLLPAFGLSDHVVSKQIGDFITNNNTKSIQLSSLLEISTLAWLFIRVITIRKRSLVPFIIWLIFIKIRYEKSVFIRNYFKSIELRIEDVVNGQGNANIKQGWVQVKQVVRKVGSIYFFNDYTKEKLT